MDTFLFDLDGTLLPMNQSAFIEAYFKGVAKTLIPYGIDSETLIEAVYEGTRAMLGNDGTVYNSKCFWDKAVSIMGEKMRSYEDIFMDYYKNEFQTLKEYTEPNPLVKECINLLKEKGYRLVLATNPLFPRIATHSRIYWSGLEPEDFQWITTYENSTYCKPNIKYYEEILTHNKITPKQCMMVGNDVNEDMIAEALSIETYLVTNCLINVDNKDVEKYKKGSFDEFYEYVRGLPDMA